jgi:hypothetical protein
MFRQSAAQQAVSSRSNMGWTLIGAAIAAGPPALAYLAVAIPTRSMRKGFAAAAAVLAAEAIYYVARR